MDDSWLSGYDRLSPILEGRDVFVLGGGPTLRNLDVSRLEGREVIATNEAFVLTPWARALVFVDFHWWSRRGEEVRETFGGLLIGRGPYRDAYRRTGVTNLAYRSGEVFSIDPRLLGGRNSGLAAVNAAWLMGAARIFLLGFDMAGDGDRNNFHNLYDDGPKAPAHRYVSIFLPEFEKAAKRLETIGGGVVINLTEGSALTYFPERSLDWALGNDR
jgi:hypothetical protein